MLHVKLKAGTYVVAVSGGVDSMALLDMLRRQTDLRLIVAHVDHGTRPDSRLDAQYVASFAKSHNIMFVMKQLELGAGASEEQARQARYDFLQKCRIKYKADAIVLAHHQDDMVETAIINLIRGTGWRGLAPFTIETRLLRPLLHVRKDDLVGYARRHNIAWRNDPTNTDQTYLRNYVRHSLIPLFNQRSNTWYDIFLRHIRNQQALRHDINFECQQWLNSNAVKTAEQWQCRRYALIMPEPSMAYELLQALFTAATGHTAERPLAEAALLFTKAARPGKRMQLNNLWQLHVTTTHIIVEPRASVVSLNEQ